MATYTRSIRRGLPRVNGGEAWPPAADGPGVDGDGVGAVDAAPAVSVGSAVVAGSAVAGVGPAVAEVSPGVADVTSGVAEPVEAATVDAVGAAATVEPVAPAAAVLHSSTAPAVGEGRALRRGLPRVPGGDPWPPESAAAAFASESAERSSEPATRTSEPAPQSLSEERSDETKRREVPDTAAVAAVASSAETGRSTAEADARETAADGSLRRGLPRVAGGEPWPPASAIRPVRSAAAAAAEAPVAAPVAPARPVRTGLPRTRVVAATPAAVTEPAAVAEPTVVAAPAHEATAPIPATTGGRSTATVDLSARPPLPFTRTVWAGTAARAPRPGPKPEPKRYGPFTKGQWAGAVIVGGAGLLFAAGMVVLFTRWFLSLEFMQEFLATYPGEYHLPAGAPVGMPPWLGWQHFFNVFLMVLIIRSGLQVRTEKRPSVFWSPRTNGRRKISLNLWFHQSLDILWIVNGVIFIVLLFATGQWMKIVPTSWAVFPNAVSAALQYVSLDWPTENGWVNYNSLQQLTYFATVFLAAPLAILTGVRMSGIWPKNAPGLNRVYPVEWARAVHFPVMIYFVLFIIVHVTLVFATGALRNLNHMYASQDVVNWVGFWIFVASLVVIAAGWIAARPLVLAPIARLFGKVTGR